ncbi:MAG TPA: hypothetical protein PLG66_12265, partial [Calditrichia bacterium]|nr:hypothetical protein [Calditrichia bacterium]
MAALCCRRSRELELLFSRVLVERVWSVSRVLVELLSLRSRDFTVVPLPLSVVVRRRVRVSSTLGLLRGFLRVASRRVVVVRPVSLTSRPRCTVLPLVVPLELPLSFERTETAGALTPV